MSNDRYERIRAALAMGPTPGPWKVGDQNGHCGISIGSDDALVATAYLRLITSRATWGEEHFAMPENQESVANATLIASCDPDTIRELLAERDALFAENARLRRGAHPAITHCDSCGCDWLDNGLNPVGCPYCELRREVGDAGRAGDSSR